VPTLPQVSYTFFLLGSDGTFAATPVKTLSSEVFHKAGQTEAELRTGMEGFSKRLALLRAEYQSADHRLNELRDRASVLANVDEIIELKLRLAKLQNTDQDNSAERERLKTLIELGRQQEDPPEVYELLQELSLHLSETAKATAMADRLNSRRREVARVNLNDRLALIREMKSVDSEALGKEILALRTKRKKLESQARSLGEQTTETDEF